MRNKILKSCLLVVCFVMQISLTANASCTLSGGVYYCSNNGGTGDYTGTSLNGTSIEKTGGGMDFLTNASNTISDEININGGTLGVVTGAGLGGSFVMNIASGAAFRTDGTQSVSNTINTNGGTINVNSGTLDFSGVLNGSAVTKAGAGTLYMNNTAAFGGAFTVNGGAVEADSGKLGGNLILNGGSLVFNEGAGDTSYSANITGTNGTLVKKGAGVLTLGGNNTARVNISEGGILINSSDNLKGALTIEQDAMLIVDGGFQMSNNITINNGSFEITAVPDTEQDEGEYLVTLSGNLYGAGFTKDGAGVLQLSTVNKYAGEIHVNEGGILATTNNFNGNIHLEGPLPHDEDGVGSFFELDQNTNGTFSGNISGGGVFGKNGTGKVTLTGNNTIAEVMIYDGSLSISSGGNIQGDIYFYGGELITEGADIVLGGSHKQVLYLDNDITADKNLNVSAGSKLTLGPQAEIGGDGNLVKNGTGTLLLNHNYAEGNYGGDLRILGGTVEVFDGGALGHEDSRVLINTAALSVLDSTVIDRGLYFQADTSTLKIADNAEVLLTQAVRGAGTLVKEGGGTLNLLSSDIQHYGGIEIKAGDVIGRGASLRGDINISAGANLIFSQAADETFLGNLTGGGDIYKEGSGKLILSGVYTGSYTGKYYLNEGTLEGSTGNLRGDILTAADTVLVFNQNYDGIYAGVISGGSGLIKHGNGRLTLSGQNTYTGDTLIEDTNGIVFESDDNLGAASSKIILNGGNIELADGNTVSTSRDIELKDREGGANFISVGDNAQLTIDSILRGTSFVKEGEGRLILTAANAHSGGTQISNGVLEIADTSALGTGFLAVTGGALSVTADMALDMNVYINGKAGFEVAENMTLLTEGLLYGGGTINKKGKGVLQLGDYNMYDGGLDIEEGKVIGNASSIRGDIKMSGGGILDFIQDTNGFYSGDIDAGANNHINKSGAGLLYMEGNSGTGQDILSVGNLNIDEGLVIAASKINGIVNVAGGAAFALEADGGGAIHNSGDFYIDNTKDTNYAGDIFIKDGGVLNITVAENKNVSFNIKESAPGSGGNLDFETGSVIEVSATGVFDAAQTSVFNIISYEGALSGDYSDIRINNNRRLKGTLDDGQSGLIALNIQRVATNYAGFSGLKDNQIAVAKALDKLSARPGGDMDLILSAMDEMTASAGGPEAYALSLTPARAHAVQAVALTQLAGQIYANIPNLNSFNALTRNAYLRMNSGADIEELGNNIWLQTTGDYNKIKASQMGENFYNFSSGAVFGFDKYKGNDWRLGFVASYTRHDLKHNDLENLDGDEYQAGGYMLMRRGGLDIASTVTAGYRDSTVERNITFLGRKAEARLRSFTFNADTEFSYNLRDVGAFEFRPFAALSATGESRQSFSESGAGAAGLSGDSDLIYTASLRAGMGLRRSGARLGYYGDVSLRQNLTEPQTSLTLDGEDYKIKPYGAGSFYGVRLGGYLNLSSLIALYGDAGGDFNSDTNNLFFNIGIRSYW